MNDAPRYVQNAVDATLKAINSGKNRILLSLATGQLTVATEILRAYYPPSEIKDKRVLVLFDRLVLLEQARRYLTDLYGDDVDVPKTVSEFLSTNSLIVVATIQKMRKNIKHLDFDLIVLFGSERVLGLELPDEKTTVQRSLELFNSLIIGIDSGSQNSSKFFGAPVFRHSLFDAIHDGALVPFKVASVKGILGEEERIKLVDYFEKENLSMVSESEGEYYRSFVITPERGKVIAKSIVEQINYQKTVVFCRTISEIDLLRKELNSITKNKFFAISVIDVSEYVQKSFELFIDDSGPIVLLAGIKLIYGLDLPNTRNIVLLTNVGSASLLSQMLSVGLRPFKGKDFLTVYDYVGVFDQQDIVNEISKRENNEAIEDPISGSNKKDKRNYISKAIITFRDRKNIDGVLGVKDIAEELAGVIKILPGERGSMIGIFGKWGRGKTFLMDEVWNKLNDQKTFERVDFHAWKYQDTPASWAYLYETLSQKYTSATNKSKQRRWFINILRVLKLNFKLNSGYPAFKLLMIVVVSTVLWWQLRALINGSSFKTSIDVIGGAAVLTFLYKLISDWNSRYGKEATKLFLKYSKKHSFKEHLGLQAEIQKELIALLKAWIPEEQISSRKIIIFVDDIDRCSELKIVQLIDALRVMLEDDEVAKRVVVITAIDERILKLAIHAKYYSIVKEGDTININMLTKEYFDKLFIIGIKLGDLSSQERDEFFLEFIKNDTVQLKDLETVPITSIDEFPGLVEPDELSQQGTSIQEVISNIEDQTNLKFDVDFMANKEAVSRIDKLYPDEIAMLRSCLKNYDNATPRQIRIFYYRFLMAKNLLIKQYSLLTRKNIWLTEEYRETFVKLIILYSQQEDALLISQHKVTILHANTDEGKVFLLENVTVPRLDYGELLKALDIVLAY
jgi:superfamily II DNA or RNA helicase